jgi:hypothetical protein
MKRCPNCQKEFPDSMRFCQTDGTSLVDVAEQAPPPDPYKTVVGGMIKMDEDLLQIPEQDDPMKTMVSPISAPKFDPPKSDVPPPPPKPISDPPLNAPPKPPISSPDAGAPKFNEPSLNPPSFGDLSPSSSGNVSSGSASSEPPRFGTAPPPKNDPPASPFGASPFSNEPSKNASPFDKPSSGGAGSSPFDKPTSAPSASPFDKAPPPPYKDPEPMFGGQQPPPFGQSPFGQPQTPFAQSNEPVNQSFQQDEWAPPPAPVAGWQDQGLGANTPFQPPAASGGGLNQTLPIISLVLGILSLCCYVSPVTGLGALITGFLGMKNANNNPAEYGGKTLAIVGMILGGLFFLIAIAYWIFVLVVGFAGFIPTQ